MNFIDFSFLDFFWFKASFRSGDVLNGNPHVQKFTWGNLCTCPDLLNEALNQKKCKNEKSIKFIFTHKKGILDFHNVVVNPPKKVKILHCFKKKNTQNFLKFWFQIWNQRENLFLKTFTPRRAIFEKISLWDGSTVNRGVLLQF